MSGKPERPANSDKEDPLLSAALRKADELDAADQPSERTKALFGLVPIFLVTMVVDYLREAAAFAALLACTIAVIVGLSTDESSWTISLVSSGTLGIALVLVPMFRHWPQWSQWLVRLAVLAIQIGLLSWQGS